MLGKKKKNNIGIDLIEDTKRYKYEISEYRMFLHNMRKNVTLSDVEYYDFFIDLLRKEIRYSSLLEINRGNSQYRYMYPFHKMNPLFLNYEGSEEKIKIDIRYNNLISSPWRHDRYKRILNRLKDVNFKYDAYNHMAIYYDGLNITSAYNGYHSLGAAVYLGGGVIEAEYYDVRKIFDVVDTNDDLSFSYDKEKAIENLRSCGQTISPYLEERLEDRFYGADYRLILIYKLCKMKFLSEYDQ